MIDKETLKLAKQIDINVIVDAYNVTRDPYNSHMIKCPSRNHDDKKPSCSYNASNNTYRCFGCGTTFDTIDIYKELEYRESGRDVTFPIAVKEVLEFGQGTSNGASNGTSNGASNGTPNGASNGTPNGASNGTPNGTSNGTSNVMTQAVQVHNGDGNLYNIVAANCKTITGYEFEYLNNRGIFIYSVYVYDGVVYSEKTLSEALREGKKEYKGKCIDDIMTDGRYYDGIAGILRENHIEILHNYYKNQNSIIYKVEYDGGTILKRQGSFLVNTNRKLMVSKAIGGQHEKKIYGNGDFIFVTEGVGEEGNNHDIYVCEGIEDALSFTSVGCKAVSLNSLSNLNSFKNHIMDNLAAYSGYRIIMVFDHDLAGERATNDFKQFLQEQGIVCYKCEFPKNFKDINQYWVSKVFEKGGV